MIKSLGYDQSDSLARPGTAHHQIEVQHVGLHHFFEGQMPRKASPHPKHLPFKKTAFFSRID
jgi:hypothetical protein